MASAPPIRLLARTVLVLLLFVPAGAAAAVHSAPSAAADVGTTITIAGHGYGHGRGMGQWGAYGYAVNAGWSAAQILDHFYGNTTAGNVGNPTVRIRLTELSLSSPYLANGTDYPSTTVQLQNGTLGFDAGQGVQQLGWHAAKLSRTGAGTFALFVANSCAGPWNGPIPVSAGTVKLLPANPDADSAADTLAICEPSAANYLRHVQGQVWAVDTGSTGITVNALPVDDYVKAVVPHEMSPSWAIGGTNMAGLNALAAQAVAVRSYGLASNAGAYNTCDSICQTYPGRWRELNGTVTDLTNNYTTFATGLTTGQVRMRGGAVIATEYSASTGGWTAGGTFPAVVDDGDAVAANPNHSWTVNVARSKIEAAYNRGTLTGITVTARNGYGDYGGRVTSMQLTFTGGTVTLTGYQFQSLLGLKSNWFTIVQPCGSPSQPLPPFPSVTAMVNQQYTDILDRAPDAAGAQSWVNQVVCNGQSAAWVISAMLAAPETQNGLVAVVRLYEGVFPRTPDAGGVLYWRHRVTTGMSLPDLATALVSSQEFRSAHDAQTNSAFVTAMYQQMLGRAPDAQGGAYWTARLDAGTITRAGFVLALSGSSEYVQRWTVPTAVNEVYIVMLRRSVDSSGGSYWQAQLRGGLSMQGFVGAIYSSAEYDARF